MTPTQIQALLKEHLVKPTKMDLYIANADGSDARQLTYLPGASFAPFFFPDGKRVIFDEHLSVKSLSSNEGAGFFGVDA